MHRGQGGRFEAIFQRTFWEKIKEENVKEAKHEEDPGALT